MTYILDIYGYFIIHIVMLILNTPSAFCTIIFWFHNNTFDDYELYLIIFLPEETVLWYIAVKHSL